MYDKENDILNFYKYTCPYCPAKFIDVPSAELHIKMMHSKIVKFRNDGKSRFNDIRLLNELHNKVI